MQRRAARRRTDEQAPSGLAAAGSDTSGAESVLANIEAVLSEA